MAYVLLTSLMLVFLNVYASTATRNLIYRSKAASLMDKAQLITSSFSSVDNLNSENTAQVISALGELNVDRIIITDSSGLSLYDSLTQRSSVGKYVLLRETTEALQGQGYDVAHCQYEDSNLLGHAAVPVVQYGSPIGCVYIADDDPDQGAIIQSLETNILRISFGVEAVIVLFSMVFAVISSSKMRRILVSMQKAREGEYSHKIKIHGSAPRPRASAAFTNRLSSVMDDRRSSL